MTNLITEKQILGKYKSKQLSCEERMINFDFTQQQWIDFHNLLYSGSITCAYTNAPFVHEVGDDRYPTIERIDNLKSYSVENCVWVTNLANTLKNLYIEGNEDESKLPSRDKGYITRIRRILTNVVNLQKIQEPYKHLFGQKTIVKQQLEEKLPMNKEISIAKMYAEFGATIEGFGAEYNLTYTQYKNLITKKTCQLTKRPLPDDLSEKSIWVVDKSIPICKGNVVVTDKNTANVLDLLQGKCKMNMKAIKMLGKTLTNV